MRKVDVITIHDGDNWEAMYLNGKCAYQGHSIDADWALARLVGCEIRSVGKIYPEDNLIERGNS